MADQSQQQFQKWLDTILSGKNINTARIRVGKAETEMGDMQEKVSQAGEIIQNASSIGEARRKLIKAGLLNTSEDD